MTKYVVEKVSTKEQYRQARQIRKEVYIIEQNVPPHEEVDEFDEASCHFLVYEDQKPIATARYRPYKSFIKVERVATLKSFRGRGVMSTLMSYLQKDAEKELPHLLLYLHAQEAAMSFYERLGWVAVGPFFEESRISHIVMIHPPKEKERIKALDCLKDSSLPEYIAKVLWSKLEE